MLLSTCAFRSSSMSIKGVSYLSCIMTNVRLYDIGPWRQYVIKSMLRTLNYQLQIIVHVKDVILLCLPYIKHLDVRDMEYIGFKIFNLRSSSMLRMLITLVISVGIIRPRSSSMSRTLILLAMLVLEYHINLIISDLRLSSVLV